MSSNKLTETAGWQPIETAPKDGSEIVALTSDGAWIVTWRDRVGGWQIKKPAGRDPLVCLGNMLGWLPLPCEDLVSDNPSKQTAPADRIREAQVALWRQTAKFLAAAVVVQSVSLILIAVFRL